MLHERHISGITYFGGFEYARVADSTTREWPGSTYDRALLRLRAHCGQSEQHAADFIVGPNSCRQKITATLSVYQGSTMVRTV